MDLDSTEVERHKFDVVRRGYDREQVRAFLESVAGSMSRLEEQRKIAVVRAEQLERQSHELQARAESTIQETVAARVRLMDESNLSRAAAESSGSSAGMTNQAKIEAQQIIEHAHAQAKATQAEAEAVIEGALATSAKINEERSELLGSTEAERIRLIAAANEEADAIRTEALLAAELARSEASARAADIRRKAETDSDVMLTEAHEKAQHITANAEIERDELLASIEASRSRLGEVERRVESAVDYQETADEKSQAAEELERMTVDLTRDPARGEPEPIGRGSRTSRYKSRSANLPHLGDNAESVIGSLGSLRTKSE